MQTAMGLMKNMFQIFPFLLPKIPILWKSHWSSLLSFTMSFIFYYEDSHIPH